LWAGESPQINNIWFPGGGLEVWGNKSVEKKGKQKSDDCGMSVDCGAVMACEVVKLNVARPIEKKGKQKYEAVLMKEGTHVEKESGRSEAERGDISSLLEYVARMGSLPPQIGASVCSLKHDYGL
jgi:hypothetical protein